MVKLTKSSGNVFKDLGFSPEESEGLLLRSSLMTSLLGIMKKRRLSPAAAAKVFGVTRSCIGDLEKGNIDRLNLDTLFGMLSRAGMAVKITLSTKRRVRAA